VCKSLPIVFSSVTVYIKGDYYVMNFETMNVFARHCHNDVFSAATLKYKHTTDILANYITSSMS
jgi:hypothetical protein